MKTASIAGDLTFDPLAVMFNLKSKGVSHLSGLAGQTGQFQHDWMLTKIPLEQLIELGN